MTRYRIRRLFFDGVPYWVLERDLRGVRGDFRVYGRLWFQGRYATALFALQLILSGHPASQALQWGNSVAPPSVKARRTFPAHFGRPQLRLIEGGAS